MWAGLHKNIFNNFIHFPSLPHIFLSLIFIYFSSSSYIIEKAIGNDNKNNSSNDKNQ